MGKIADTSSYWYLATVYTLYPEGQDKAFEFAAEQAALLINAGVPVYCPIAMTHPIADAELRLGLPKKHLDYDKWLELDAVFLRHAKGIILVRSENWEQSKGMFSEKVSMWTQQKPVVYMDPGKVPAEVMPYGIYGTYSKVR